MTGDDRPPGRKRDGPRKGRPNAEPPPASTDTRRVSRVADSRACWRCSVTASSVARWLALSAERDLQLALRLASWREGYRLGREDGWRAGYETARAELDAAWHAVAARVARGASDPTYAELERRRWTVHGEPRTRETFGLPHPADRRPGRSR
jgi:hypothetical protein